MSIKILSPDQIKETANNKATTSPLIFAKPTRIYKKRILRLQELAKAHPMADYLTFVTKIVEAQNKLLESFSLNKKIELSQQQFENKPLNIQYWKKDPIWIDILYALLKEIKPSANEVILNTISELENTSKKELDDLATKLLNQQFKQVSSDKAIFLWSALSFYWTQLAQNISHNAIMESDQALHTCPVCDSAPVSSIIHAGLKQGLRYLHCSLCETQWNIVRAKCSSCSHMEKLNYWSIDEEFASVRTESCGQCNSYLKLLFEGKDPDVDAVADDLASIYLDLEMGEKGFIRSGLNPFLFNS